MAQKHNILITKSNEPSIFGRRNMYLRSVENDELVTTIPNLYHRADFFELQVDETGRILVNIGQKNIGYIDAPQNVCQLIIRHMRAGHDVSVDIFCQEKGSLSLFINEHPPLPIPCPSDDNMDDTDIF